MHGETVYVSRLILLRLSGARRGEYSSEASDEGAAVHPASTMLTLDESVGKMRLAKSQRALA